VRAIGLIALILVLPGITDAQIFPVRADIQLRPPYSLYLADYTAPGTDRMKVTLRLLQTNRPLYSVGLRITIEGAGITIVSSPNGVYDEIVLQGGASLDLSGSDLLTYLNPENLIFNGYSKEDYLRTNKLPEGIYQISVEAIDFRNYQAGIVVSNRSTATAWFMLNDPPRFNQPFAGELVKTTFPQNVFFQWLPLHLNSPNAAFQTEYHFQLFEINPGIIEEERLSVDEQVANQAVQANQVFYEAVLQSPTLAYNNSLPALIPGKFYAARVRVVERNNLDIFKNNGYSEVIWFRFGETCKPANNLRSQVQDFRKAELSWDGKENHSRYTVSYRPEGGSEWYEQENLTTTVRITDLQPNTAYELQVRAYCGSLPAEASDIVTLQTPENNQNNAEVKCGESVALANVDKGTSLATASPGSKFKVGAFSMRVTEVTGSNGSFSGKGEIFVPFLATTVKTEFSSIRVNDKSEVFDGVVKAQSSGVTLMDQATLRKLIEDEQNELVKNSRLCIEEEESEPVSETEPATPVITIGEFVVAKGDTLIVNGKVVIVDESTVLQPDDVITIPKQKDKGKNIVIDKQEGVENGKKKYSVKSGSAGTGTLGALEKEVDDLLKKVLTNLKGSNQDSISRYGKQVEQYSEAILRILKEHDLPKEMVGGEDEVFLWKGMSKKKKIPHSSTIPDSPIGQIYTRHRSLFVADSALQFSLAKDEIIEGYLEKKKLEQFKLTVKDKLKELDQEVLDSYQPGGPAYKELEQFLYNIVNDIVTKSTEVFIASEVTSFLILEKNDHATALAAASHEVNKYWIGGLMPPPVLSDSSGEVGAFSPAVYAHALQYIIVKHQRQVYMMNPTTATDLPVGLVQEIAGKEWIVAIDSMVFSSTGAYFNAFMSVEVPFTENVKLPFALQKIRFTPYGISGVTSARLNLAKDVLIPISAEVQLVLKNSGTFAEIDCYGFKSLGLAGEFEFCENIIVPDGANGKPADGRVKARFSTTLHDWSEFLAEIDIDAFQLKSLPEWGFTVDQAIVDMSDIANGGAMNFPPDYQSTSFIDGNKNFWKGFYLREASVKLPPHFKLRSGPAAAAPATGEADKNAPAPETRITISVNDVLIDNMGFTGTFGAKNLLPLSNGDLNGWNFSIDSVKVSLQASALKSGKLYGSIDVPMLKPEVTAKTGTESAVVADFKYSAIIESGNKYQFSVDPIQNLSIPMWGAGKLELLPSSSMQLSLTDGKLQPKVILNGKMSIGVGLSDKAQEGSNFSIASVSFEQLTLTTTSPYVTAAGFSLGIGNGNKLGNFPISINQIGFRKIPDQNNQIGLGFNLVVNLVGENDGGFGAECGVTVIAENKNGWRYKGIDVSKIAINVDGGAFKMAGQLDFFKQDAVYGNGFKGQVQASFVPGLTLNAMALFGEVGNTRYWYADGKVGIDTGLPFTPGLAFYGFGGGAYYHMKMAGHNETIAGDLGKTPSGIVYRPDPATHLGIKAGVIIGTHPEKAAFNGDVTLEVAFNARGGVNTVALSGNGYFVTPPMTDLETLSKMVKTVAARTGSPAANETSQPVAPNRPDAQLYANMLIRYDVPNETLHGNLKVFVNIAGGAVKGRLANNLAGEAVVHFDPSEWYVHLGTPDERAGLKALGLFDLNSYLMTGTDVPDMPAPPAHVSRILGEDFNSMRDNRMLSRGGGFVFGADVSFDTGDLTFLMFYGRFLMGQGFDIMLKNYGSDAHCSGRPAPLGINGWYAAGQAYAYMDGRIGINVDLPFYSGKYEILKIAGAAIFQAKLPNPVWLKGRAGGHFSILGGAVKGDCDFEIEIGDNCKIMAPGSVLAGMKVISQLTPAASENNVNVFTATQSIFNMPVNTDFSLTDLDGQEKTFRIKLEHFKVLDEGREVPGTLRWNDDNTVLAFDSYDILPPKKSLTANVKVSFEENVRGTWIPVKVKGAMVTETMENSFTTGEAPDFIPAENVAYSYPVRKQLHFHKDEHPEGYIKLKKGQPYLFTPGNEWDQKVRFKKTDGSAIDQELAYSNQQVHFPIPQGLETSTVYTWEIVNIPVVENGAVDENVYASAETIQGSGVEVTTKEAEGSIEMLQEKSIFSAYFRTSKYSTFAAKFNSLQSSAPWMNPIRAGVQELGLSFTGTEYFDKAELISENDVPSLVQLEADLARTTWYNSVVYPLIYRDYQLYGYTLDWRKSEPVNVGIPPRKAVSIKQFEYDDLGEEEWKQGKADPSSATGAYPIYRLSHYVMKDHSEFVQKAAAQALHSSNPWIANLLTAASPYLLFPSDYPVTVRYVLPGTTIITFQRTITFRRN
jgi:hypothetical protein